MKVGVHNKFNANVPIIEEFYIIIHNAINFIDTKVLQ